MSEFFRRIEKKYIITREQYLALKDTLKNKMIEDEYGKSTICNIYFDTEQFDLIRHSITKPIYKDKVRLRSYNIPTKDSMVYLEIKRKYDGVVSKRRVGMKLIEFYEYMNDKTLFMEKKQIKKELLYYFEFYNLKQAMFISYDRRAYYDKTNRDFRITFDNNILARNYNLALEEGIYGTDVLGKGKYIMEIKTLGAMPIWLVKILEELRICPYSFSKYGEAYMQLVLKADCITKYAV